MCERQRLNDLFNYALVLITAMGASGLGAVAVVKPSEVGYALFIFTYPIVVLIVAWLMKELMSVGEPIESSQDSSFEHYAKKIYRALIIFLTDFCWYFWAIMLVFFLNYLVYFVTDSFDLTIEALTIIVYLVLGLLIKFAHVRALGRDHTKLNWALTVIAVIVSISLMVWYTQFHF